MWGSKRGPTPAFHSLHRYGPTYPEFSFRQSSCAKNSSVVRSDFERRTTLVKGCKIVSEDVVDFRAVEDCIRDLCDRFNVMTVGIVPHLAHSTLNALSEDGYPTVALRQGWVPMAPAIKDLERVTNSHRFQHGEHDVLRGPYHR